MPLYTRDSSQHSNSSALHLCCITIGILYFLFLL
jgi:hypothetical protein